MSTTPESSDAGECSELRGRFEAFGELAESHLLQAAGGGRLLAVLLVVFRSHLQLAMPTSPNSVREGTPHRIMRLTVVEKVEGR